MCQHTSGETTGGDTMTEDATEKLCLKKIKSNEKEERIERGKKRG